MTSSKSQKFEAWLTIAAIVSVVVVISFCVWRVIDKRVSDGQEQAAGESSQKAVEKSLAQQQVMAEQGKVREAVSELIHSNNAVTDWEQTLKTEGSLRPRYSAELSKVLVIPDKRPLLFIVDVKDIALMDGKFQCSFSRNIGLQKLELDLTCNPQMADQVMGGPEFGKYAVVAEISSVGLKEKKSGEDDADAAADDLGIGMRFVANGKCDGLVYVGNGYH